MRSTGSSKNGCRAMAVISALSLSLLLAGTAAAQSVSDSASSSPDMRTPDGTPVSLAAYAENRKEFHYAIANNGSVMLSDRSGNIAVKAVPGRHVTVVATIISGADNVDVDSHPSTNGQRIEFHSHVINQTKGPQPRVDYEVQVPADVSVTIESGSGEVRLEGVRGIVEIETESASVSVRKINNGSVQIQSVNGDVNLSDLSNMHVEVASTSGNIELYSVYGHHVDAKTTSGNIRYTGNFQGSGEYTLRTHTGDVNVFLPFDSSIDLSASSVKGTVENDFPFEPTNHPSFSPKTSHANGLYEGTSKTGESKVKLRSFSGKIRVKKQ